MAYPVLLADESKDDVHRHSSIDQFKGFLSVMINCLSPASRAFFNSSFELILFMTLVFSLKLSFYPTPPLVSRIIQPFAGIGQQFVAVFLEIEEITVG